MWIEKTDLCFPYDMVMVILNAIGDGFMTPEIKGFNGILTKTFQDFSWKYY